MGVTKKRPVHGIQHVCWVLLAAGWLSTHACASQHAVQGPADAETRAVVPAKSLVVGGVSKRADFDQVSASREARHVADWVVDSGDNLNKPFVIVDKREARVFVFDATGKLRGKSSALLGLAIGDHSVPGIGDKKLSDIRPEERTTPAGRFVANLDKNLKGQEMLWVDYDTAISMHPVVAGHPRERRAERLASLLPAERRISYGCINIPASFYKGVVSPAFAGTDGIVYVLPEVRSVKEVLGTYDVGE